MAFGTQPTAHLLNTDLGHEVCPATGGVVNGVQLLQQGGGVGQGVVAIQQPTQQVTVRPIQQLRVTTQVRGQLRRGGHQKLCLCLCYSMCTYGLIRQDKDCINVLCGGQ